jgi:hypothetical protein
MWSLIKLDFSFYDFSMIFLKIHRKTDVTVAKPLSKTAQGVRYTVLESSGGKTDSFIVEG